MGEVMELSTNKIIQAMDAVFDKYKGCTFSMPYLASQVIKELEVSYTETDLITETMTIYVKANPALYRYGKGSKRSTFRGGVYRIADNKAAYELELENSNKQVMNMNARAHQQVVATRGQIRSLELQIRKEKAELKELARLQRQASALELKLEFLRTPSYKR